MLFIGAKSILVLVQFLQHFSFITICVLFFTTKTEGFEVTDLIFPAVSVLTRSMIIAIRYSFVSKSRYSVMKLRNSADWVYADLIVFNWDRISFSSINHEIKASIYRLRIEEDDFNFTFLKPLSHDYHNKLSNPEYYQEKNLSMKKAAKEIEVLRKKASKNKTSPLELEATHTLTKLNNTQKEEDQKEDKKLNVTLIFTFR